MVYDLYKFNLNKLNECLLNTMYEDLLVLYQILPHHFSIRFYRISDVMVGILASSVVDWGFEPWSGQTKD